MALMAEAIQLVEDHSLRVTDTGYEVQLRLLWYRSLPLSCIERIEFSLDGQSVDPNLIRFGINGHQYRLDELADLVEEYWFIQDSASLSVSQPGKVVTGNTYNVKLDLSLRFPYIPIGPGKFLTNINQYSAAQVAH